MKKKGIQSDLLLSTLNGIRAVADVTANSKGEISTDGTCIERSGLRNEREFKDILYQERRQEDW